MKRDMVIAREVDADYISRFSHRIIPFVVGLLAAQKLVVGGEIYAGEIFAFVYLLLNLNKINIGSSLRPMILLGAVWSICQFISDMLNQTDLFDSAKGIGAPLVFISSVIALSMYFTHDVRRMPSFLIGVYLGSVPAMLIFPNEYFIYNPWKWGIGSFVLGFFAVIYTFFLTRKKVIYLLGFIAVFFIISILNDARSMAIFPVFAAIAYVFMRSRNFDVILRLFRGKFAIVKLVLVIFALLLSINAAFTAVFSSDWVLEKLPEASAEKFRMQASGDYGVLLGGRKEILVSTEAFLDKPLIGHGSWAKDDDGYQEQLAELSYKLGYSEREDPSFKSDLIPVHSHIMGALVWAGIGGGLFWLYMIRWLLLELIVNARFLGFYFYEGIIDMMWAIMFSPFGASARWGAAVFVAALYCYSRWISKNRIVNEDLDRNDFI